MQLMPGTAKDVARKLDMPAPKKNDLHDPEINMRLGSAYLAQMLGKFNGSQVLASAAYNAGPNRIAQYRKEAARRGLNGNIWFDNVERVAAAKVGAETVQYVKSVSSRYVAYRRSYELNQQRKQLRPR